jgi:hypothetical protein
MGRTSSANGECRACQGAHRAHTCRDRGLGALPAPARAAAAEKVKVSKAKEKEKEPKEKETSSAPAASVRPYKASSSKDVEPPEPAQMNEADRIKLVALQNELKGSHTIHTVAAAKELLDGDGECDRNALCAKHGITASPAAFERITAVVKQLGLLHLPKGAVSMEDPNDSNLLNDLQLLLQTANGVGGHSRSACGTHRACAPTRRPRRPDRRRRAAPHAERARCPAIISRALLCTSSRLLTRVRRCPRSIENDCCCRRDAPRAEAQFHRLVRPA